MSRGAGHSERGAALLVALLTVAMVATLAAAGLWQQWRAAEVESAERQRAQASWVLSGALDWARLILREDGGSSGSVDHLGEPWAVPLREARLATFLAANRDADISGSSAERSGSRSSGRANATPVEARSTLGWSGSAPPPSHTSSTPAARAVRSNVPRLPGSCN